MALLKECPDILGTISPQRALLGAGIVQVAAGVYPRNIALDAPFQVLVLLQNATDRPVNTKLKLMPPRRAANGQRASFFMPRATYEHTLEPLEVAIVYLPLVATPPTMPDQQYPLQVQCLAQTLPDATLVRLPTPERPAHSLNISPVHVDVLREVQFGATVPEPDHLRVMLHVIPGTPGQKIDPGQPSHRTIWGIEQLKAEVQAAEHYKDMAKQFAKNITREQLMPPMQELVAERFAELGFPLKPGEDVMIAKLMAYVVERAFEQEAGFRLEKSHWYVRLTRLLATDETILDDLYSVLSYLFTAIVADSINLGLYIVRVNLKLQEDTAQEKYATEVFAALTQQSPLTPRHAYLPFVMAGITLNLMMRLPSENVHQNIYAIEEALAQRKSEDAAFNETAAWAERLVQRAMEALRQLL